METRIRVPIGKAGSLGLENWLAGGPRPRPDPPGGYQKTPGRRSRLINQHGWVGYFT